MADRSYHFYRVATSGSAERLFDGPWSLNWSLDLHRRRGSGYRGDSQRDDLKMRADELALWHHLADQAVMGFGRLLPRARRKTGAPRPL